MLVYAKANGKLICMRFFILLGDGKKGSDTLNVKIVRSRATRKLFLSQQFKYKWKLGQRTWLQDGTVVKSPYHCDLIRKVEKGVVKRSHSGLSGVLGFVMGVKLRGRKFKKMKKFLRKISNFIQFFFQEKLQLCKFSYQNFFNLIFITAWKIF